MICNPDDMDFCKTNNNVVRLIKEIEKRPPLYQTTLKAYSDLGLKKQLWDEICFILIKGWNKLSPEDKIKRAHILQKKWHNIRTCFTRELRAREREVSSGQTHTSRKKYCYFDNLLFLLPDGVLRKSNAETVACISSPVESDQNKEVKTEYDNKDDSQDDEGELQFLLNQKVKGLNKEKECCDGTVLKILKKKINNIRSCGETSNLVLDEETNFALSLIPTLKSLPEETKLEAKIEILSVLQRLKYGQSTSQVYYEDPQDPIV